MDTQWWPRTRRNVRGRRPEVVQLGPVKVVRGGAGGRPQTANIPGGHCPVSSGRTWNVSMLRLRFLGKQTSPIYDRRQQISPHFNKFEGRPLHEYWINGVVKGGFKFCKILIYDQFIMFMLINIIIMIINIHINMINMVNIQNLCMFIYCN